MAATTYAQTSDFLKGATNYA